MVGGDSILPESMNMLVALHMVTGGVREITVSEKVPFVIMNKVQYYWVDASSLALVGSPSRVTVPN